MNRATAGVDLSSKQHINTIHNEGDTMKYFFATLIVALLTLNTSYSQESKRITRSFSMDDALIVRELGAVIVPKNDLLIVEVILGNHEKENSDIQKDDHVLMANGKKVNSIKELRAQYEHANVGEEFKVGLKRGENLMIAKFIKKSEEELNKEGSRGGMVMRMEKKEGEEVLPALGLVVGTKNKSAVVISTLPSVSNNFKSFEPKQGDILVSINGKSVSSAEEFSSEYTELHEGDKVTIVVSRDGKELKEIFSKPKPMGRMIMKQ
ncbi:MAG: PDZ domain-containing protein [Bacteroidota bacterium]